jgi:hypothetical protein
MLRFQLSIYGGARESAGRLPVTFEQAAEALAQLERLFIEPDGSFVWTGQDADGESWQVDGNLIDRGDALAYAEVKGRCPAKQFDRLLAAFGWPHAPLAFHLPQRGVMVSESELRKLATSEAGAI